MSVSRETERLATYAGLLRKWNPAINLIAASTIDQIEARHIADSLHLVEIAKNAQGSWVDLGSGGGLPGIVVAIMRPDLELSMVESDQRKGAFLRNAIRELALPHAKVLCKRIELWIGSMPPISVQEPCSASAAHGICRAAPEPVWNSMADERPKLASRGFSGAKRLEVRPENPPKRDRS